MFTQFKEEHDAKLVALENKIKKIRADDYYDEEESQGNTSIEDVDIEDDDEMSKESANKSRKSFEHRRDSNDLINKVDRAEKQDIVKSLHGSEKKLRGSYEKGTTNMVTIEVLGDKPPIKHGSSLAISGISSTSKPIMEVLTTVKDEFGETTQVKGVTYEEEEKASIKKSTR